MPAIQVTQPTVSLNKVNLNQVTLPARDLAASAAFYRRMGFLQIVDSPHYARFECTEGEATFSLHAAAPAAQRDANARDGADGRLIDGTPIDGGLIDGALTDGGLTDGASADAMSTDSGFTVYFEHDGLDALVARLQAEGFAFETMPADQPWLWREARLRDPSGNLICLYRAGAMRRHPPWRVERRADDPA